jgi:3-methyladenine DNA glycosylase AlkD
MHPEHSALLDDLRKAARPIHHDRPPQNDSYGGSGRPFFNVSVPDRSAIIKRWLAGHKTITADAFFAVVDSLTQGQSHEEKTLAGMLVAANRKARPLVSTRDIDRWLGRLNGWAEVDTWCQNVFKAEDMLADWLAWRGLIDQLSRDANINKRRAALVLLNGPVHYSPDPRFRDLAFTVLERLKPERPILITKAVSWLLRSMITQHRDAVVAYLAANETSRPAIALRETRTKLKTGTKSGRKAP